MDATNELNSRQQKTIEYYQTNASEYVEQTQDIDMQHIYGAFLPLVPKGGEILDVGCGSGRDLKYFRDQGYAVQGIEPAPALAEISRMRSGVCVLQIRVEELQLRGKYDGIWACASLLHTPRILLHDVLNRLIDALKPHGVLYMSFKKGQADYLASDGRFFDDQTCDSLAKIAETLPEIEILRCWETRDRLRNRQTLVWTNMLVRKLPT